jgi:adhesin transport system membrane fusion protein
VIEKHGERAFARVGAVSGKMGQYGRPLLDRLFSRAMGSDVERQDWAGDADWACLQQEPLRARALLRIALIVIVALVVWAGFAQLDEVTRGEARVIPSSQVQVVQSVDGGIVEEISVAEGDVVSAGDLLLRIDPTRFVSSLRENRAEYLALLAKTARLQAFTNGEPLMLLPEVLREVPEIAEHERRLFNSSVDGLSAQVGIARQQLVQREQELNEARARNAQATRGMEFAAQELAVTRPLIESGAVSEVDILRLEREVSRLRGERDQTGAQISRIQSAIGEASRRIQEVELNVRNQHRAELSETMSRLGSLSAGSRALADRVKHAEVRSPVRGTINRLLVTTVGGVVQPGNKIAEIVPLDDALILEAKFKPKDIAFLRPGLPAKVKFTAYDFAIYGGLDAVVENISADTVADQKGEAFFTVLVRTKTASLGENLPIIPGMLAEVDVLTGKKSVLAYLLKPVLRAKSNALTER